jgi:hypothetical protein
MVREPEGEMPVRTYEIGGTGIGLWVMSKWILKKRRGR